MPSARAHRPGTNSLCQTGVLICIGWRACAHDLQRHGADVEQLVTRARRDQCTVAFAEKPLLAVDDQAPFAIGDEIQLLARSVVVLSRRCPDRNDRLGQALVLRRRRNPTGPLSDLRAVERGKRLELL